MFDAKHWKSFSPRGHKVCHPLFRYFFVRVLTSNSFICMRRLLLGKRRQHLPFGISDCVCVPVYISWFKGIQRHLVASITCYQCNSRDTRYDSCCRNGSGNKLLHYKNSFCKQHFQLLIKIPSASATIYYTISFLSCLIIFVL